MGDFLDAATSSEIKELKDIRIKKETIHPSPDEDVKNKHYQILILQLYIKVSSMGVNIADFKLGAKDL